MKVADIVREFDRLGGLKDLLYHGKIKGIIKTPKEFEGLTPVRGNWAVLELYAITVKGENPFGFSDTTYLTPKSSVCFVLDDFSLVSKLVTVSGSRGRGLELRRKGFSSNRLGYFIPVFSKTSDGWMLQPNTVKRFEKTTSKEVNELFSEYSKFEPYYLPVVNSVQGFHGSSVYEYLEGGNFKSKAGITYKTDFSLRISEKNSDNLRKSLYLADKRHFKFEEECTKINKKRTSTKELQDFIKKINGLAKNSKLLIPETTVRVGSLLGSGISSYSEFIESTMGVFLPAEIDDVLFYSPHQLYLLNLIDFDLAEQLYYITAIILNDLDFDPYRDVSLVVEGLRRVYIRSGHSLLLDSLSSPLACKISKDLQPNYKSNGSPLPLEIKNLLGYLYPSSSVDYSKLYNSGMYYITENSSQHLKTAQDYGLVVIPKKGYYSLTSVAWGELDLVDSCSSLSLNEFDYEMEDLQPHISEVESRNKTNLSRNQLRSLITLNTGFGIFLGNRYSGFEDIQYIMFESAKSKGYFKKAVVIDSSFEKDSHYDEIKDVEFYHINHLCHDLSRFMVPSEDMVFFDTDYLDHDLSRFMLASEPIMVFVNNAHTLNIDELVAIMDWVHSGSSVYLFGNPWSSLEVLNSLTSKFPTAVVLDGSDESYIKQSLSTVNSSFSLSKGKDLKVSSVQSASTLSSVRNLVSLSLERGISKNQIRIISDLEGSMSFSKLNTKLLSNFISEEQVANNYSGLPVFSDGCTYQLYYEGTYIGTWFGIIYGDLLDISDGIAEVSLGGGKYVATLDSSLLYGGHCIPSCVGELYPRGVSFVVCQRNRGLLCCEDLIRSLGSADGVSFVGSSCVIDDASWKYSKLPSTVIGSVL